MLPEPSISPTLKPLIIPRPEHNLSRQFVAVEALKVLYRLHHNGYKAYLVGGSVRDLLLGKLPKDFDLATDARPGEVRKLFRNSRIIGRRFRLVQVFFRGGKIIEVSTFRCRSEFEDTPDSTLARNNTFGTPGEDAYRRDLTINALFYNIADFSLVDYVGGLEDLRRGYVRVIGDPAVRFLRDPVRMLRVLRHAARTGFTIDPAAWEEIQAKATLIRICPPSRLRDELLKDFKSGAAAPFLDLMLKSGLFYGLLPSWESRLGQTGERRLLELIGRLDAIYRGEGTISENLVWAMFLTPYLEQVEFPENFKERREAVAEMVHGALDFVEFPRQRRDEVSFIMALEGALAPFLRSGRQVPARLARLAAYPEAWLFYQLKHAPLEELWPLVTGEPVAAPSPPPPKRRRSRGRRRRPRMRPGGTPDRK